MKLLLVLLVALPLKIVVANTACPGAPESSYKNGQLSCDRPSCPAGTAGSFYASPDPTRYFVCAGPDRSYEMRCAPGSCFSPKSQGCVNPRDWTDFCQRPEEQTTTSTTTTTTESTTSSPVPVTTPDIPYNGKVCPGVDPAVSVDQGSFAHCHERVCMRHLMRYQPISDPQRFYECRIMTDGNPDYLDYMCHPAGSCFSMVAQKCVEASAWENSCKNRVI